MTPGAVICVPSIPPARTDRSRRRILVVEDSPTQAAEATIVMEACGYDSAVAGDARAARQMVASTHFDLILTDVLMPEVSGFELCRSLKSNPATAGIPVVLLTTLNRSADVVRGLESGADGFVCKPYDPAYLAERVERAIARRAAGGAASADRAATDEADQEAQGPEAAEVRYLVEALDSLERSRAELGLGTATSDDALRRSEERFALAASGANDVLWDWDLTSGTMYFSPRLADITGYPPEEFPSDFWEWVERVHPADRGRLEIELASHISGTLPSLQNEHRYARRDGGYRWVLLRGCSVRNAEGRAYRIAGSLTDVHQRRQFEEQLLANTRELKLLLQSSSDLYLWLNAAGETIDVRSGTAAVLALLPGAERGKSIHEKLPAAAAQRWQQALEQRARTDTEVSFCYEIDHRDVEARLIPLSGGLTLTVVRDVSERKGRERQLADELAAARAAFEEAPVPLASIDRYGFVLGANRALREVLGYEEPRLPQLHYRRVFAADAGSGCDALDAVLGGTSARCEESVRLFPRSVGPIRYRMTATATTHKGEGGECCVAVFVPG